MDAMSFVGTYVARTGKSPKEEFVDFAESYLQHRIALAEESRPKKFTDDFTHREKRALYFGFDHALKILKQ